MGMHVQGFVAAPPTAGGYAVAAVKRNTTGFTNISGPQPTDMVRDLCLASIHSLTRIGAVFLQMHEPASMHAHRVPMCTKLL